MSKFIKLTNILLNTNNINKILIKPNKYFIYIMNNEINGFMWIVGRFWLGNISTYNTSSEIEVCETKHPIDYKIVSERISKN